MCLSLTLRSSRTQPARPAFISLHSSFITSFSSRSQVGPLSCLVRRHHARTTRGLNICSNRVRSSYCWIFHALLEISRQSKILSRKASSNRQNYCSNHRCHFRIHARPYPVAPNSCLASFVRLKRKARFLRFRLKSTFRFFDCPARFRPTAARSITTKLPKVLRHTSSACPRHFGSFGGISLLFGRIGRYDLNIRQFHHRSQS